MAQGTLKARRGRSAGTVIAALVVAAAVVTGSAAAQDRPGRFQMQPTDGGVIRLDTETGAMALCARRQDQWTCEPMGDASRQEVERLRAENAELKATVKHLEEMLGVGAEKDRRAEGPGVTLPTEKDVDRAMDYIERMYKKLRDRLRQLEGQSRSEGTPL